MLITQKLFTKNLNPIKILPGKFQAWQNYLFFKNLKLKNISLKKTINWFENQSLDKGWNFGVQTFSPKLYAMDIKVLLIFLNTCV